MKKNKNIVFLTGDLGFNALESLQDSFPDRFINVGIAEANMIGVAAGLALTGKKVIAYSIASFITMKAFEQIRNDVCYHNLDVKIVGTGGGFNYSSHGFTHHTIEDVALLSSLPNMTVLNPSYSWEAEGATEAMLKSEGPTYIRLGKNPSVKITNPKSKFKIGKGFVVKEGKDIVLIITGNTIDYGLNIADIIKEKTGLSTCLISMPSLKPLDTKLILEKAKSARLISTFEEHSIFGGLGSLVAMTLSISSLSKKLFLPFSIPDRYIRDVGSREFLLKKAGLDPQSVARKIIKTLKHK